MPVKDEIKSIIVKSGWTMSGVVEELNKKHSTDYTVQNFSNKLSRETLRYKEALEIANIIGCRIQWINDEGNVL